MLDVRLANGFWGLRLACAVQSAVCGLIQFNTGNARTGFAGVISLAAGLLLFTPLAKHAERFLVGWLLLLAIQAITVHAAYHLAVHNIVLAAEVFALLRLTQVSETAPKAVVLAPERSPSKRSSAPALITRRHQVLGSERVAVRARDGAAERRPV